MLTNHLIIIDIITMKPMKIEPIRKLMYKTLVEDGPVEFL